MTNATAFVHAIHAAPNDAAPRLVYADWLDEHGEPVRADLIRRMCRVPTYVFRWSRRARHGRHLHAESIRDIRGLRGRVETVYHDEWPLLPGVELVQVCRGFIESIHIWALPFLAHAGEIFARHPVRDVRLVGLHTWMSASRPGQYEGVLQPGRTDDRHWPLELFPEYAAGTSVFFAHYHLMILDLSRRAAGYGRRMAGVLREPPTLPNRPETGRPWWHEQWHDGRSTGTPPRRRTRPFLIDISPGTRVWLYPHHSLMIAGRGRRPSLRPPVILPDPRPGRPPCPVNPSRWLGYRRPASRPRSLNFCSRS